MTSISIVIPAFQAARTIDLVLGSALPQATAHGAEIIVVESSADGYAAALQQRWPAVDVVALDSRAYPGRARNIGAARATGEVIVFLDADAVPEPGWLSGLLDALAASRWAAAGAIANGTPGSPTGTAGWLLEFSNWLPGARDVPDHAASASLAVRRRALDEAGGFLNDVWPGEDTILTFPWGTTGRLAFAPTAVVTHLNRTRVQDLLRHQIALGRAFGEVCAAVPFDHCRFGRRPWSALAGILRLLALARRLRRRPREAALALLLSPWLLIGLVAWTIGLWRHGRDL